MSAGPRPRQAQVRHRCAEALALELIEFADYRAQEHGLLPEDLVCTAQRILAFTIYGGAYSVAPGPGRAVWAQQRLAQALRIVREWLPPDLMAPQPPDIEPRLLSYGTLLNNRDAERRQARERRPRTPRARRNAVWNIAFALHGLASHKIEKERLQPDDIVQLLATFVDDVLGGCAYDGGRADDDAREAWMLATLEELTAKIRAQIQRCAEVSRTIATELAAAADAADAA
jgi:hypothetical protein